MFGIDFEALLLLAVLAFILFGPQKLPEYAAKLGCLIAKLKQATAELNEQCQASFPSALQQPTPETPASSAETPPKAISTSTGEPGTEKPVAEQATAATAAPEKTPVKPAVRSPGPYVEPIQSGTGELFCPLCYKELSREFAFCPGCGHQMRKIDYTKPPSEVPSAPVKEAKSS